MSDAYQELNDNNFADTIKKGVTLVDLWAPWCGPCKQQGPIVETLADKFSGKCTIAKLNVDENAETAAKYNVMSIPTILLFKDNELREQLVGLQPEAVLEEKLNSLL